MEVLEWIPSGPTRSCRPWARQVTIDESHVRTDESPPSLVVAHTASYSKKEIGRNSIAPQRRERAHAYARTKCVPHAEHSSIEEATAAWAGEKPIDG
jgi:hypothetical protein